MMRRTGSVSCGQSTITSGFEVLLRYAWYSSSSRCSMGTSFAVANVHMRSSSGVASMTVEPSRMSWRVAGLSCPVRKSSVLAMQAEGLKCGPLTRSKTMSCAAVAPAMPHAGGSVDSASRTSASGMRTTPVS